MGLKVIIETTDEEGHLEAIVQFSDVDCQTAGRLGQLIGYAINGVEPFIAPGDVVDGIEETLIRTEINTPVGDY